MNFDVHGFRFFLALLHPIAILSLNRSSRHISLCWIASFASSLKLVSSSCALTRLSFCAMLSLSCHFLPPPPVRTKSIPPSNSFRRSLDIFIWRTCSVNCATVLCRLDILSETFFLMIPAGQSPK